MDEADSDWCFVTSLEFVHVLCRGPHYPKGWWEREGVPGAC